MKKMTSIALVSIFMLSHAYSQFFTLPSESEIVLASDVAQVGSDIAPHYEVTPLTADFVVSSLIGADIYTMEGENIGKVKDILLRQNDIEGIIIVFGGFLGIGERYVVVPSVAIKMTHDDGKWKLITHMTKDALQDAPEFKYEGLWVR
ncbi:hypothetical protein H704_00905 [Bartonella bacilliformis Peru38]|uniref:PRC-barrel domain-containing protein n=1 Tax=Bartonella bacilliformis TaxID=774 RepID=UPI00044A433C|nr:PRC-barrel domain-containing protein [Bartonella bacilliformis]EYS94708.1 hypothetical protein X470_01000 [Bartonella bacilliformis Peru-18]KEG16309.1 hypothetical protein H709_00894 [Bartonella bacilliformis CUSCO5]KEG17013.1 hypothetical protein H705_00905 [Bartonella bacilliformis Cond044]KEG20257.1 hypothetical protein H704_00905 [Bartonella bacilliformis Peru38]KZM37682.1 photosystem reaction center subunit H [Bartonella bacilliformis]